MSSLTAPFPYFGGKRTVATEVWAGLGDTPNFIEPFFGSGAVLLARPTSHQWWDRIETVNDLDGMISNFWRAVQADPDDVAQWADWPVNENDLTARHLWLVNQKGLMQARLEGAPDWYDAKVAGWWVWGISQWIGSGWCSGEGPWQSVDGLMVKTGNDSQGAEVNGLLHDAPGITRQLPHLTGAGQGINRRRPHLTHHGYGIHSFELSDDLHLLMQMLCNRLRRVRVCCGDWERICGSTPTIRNGLTGVFLDPPYRHADRDPHLYRVDNDIWDDVRQWALEHGNDALMRIALCGYVGDYDMPGWRAYCWKAPGGYARLGEGRGADNREKEVIWFSPHCLIPGQQLVMKI